MSMESGNPLPLSFSWTTRRSSRSMFTADFRLGRCAHVSIAFKAYSNFEASHVPILLEPRLAIEVREAHAVGHLEARPETPDAEGALRAQLADGWRPDW